MLLILCGRLENWSSTRQRGLIFLVKNWLKPTVVTVKSLCTTRWTARTSAIDAVLKDYSILMETMSEVNATTRDEYGLKAGRILAALEKFSTLFGLRLAFLLFATAEEVSKGLQDKDTTLQQALASIDLASSFYRRQSKHSSNFSRSLLQRLKISK